MFSWGIVCVLMTTMTTVWEFYLYRFLLGLCEASLYPVVYSLLIPNWFLSKERAKAISLMLTSLLFSNIIGGPLAGILLDTTFFGMGGAYTLHRRGITCCNLCFHFAFWMKENREQASWVSDAEKAYMKEELAKRGAKNKEVKKYTTWQALRDPQSITFIFNLLLMDYWLRGFSFGCLKFIKVYRLATKCGSLVYCYPNDGCITCASILWSLLREAQ